MYSKRFANGTLYPHNFEGKHRWLQPYIVHNIYAVWNCILLLLYMCNYLTVIAQSSNLPHGRREHLFRKKYNLEDVDIVLICIKLSNPFLSAGYQLQVHKLGTHIQSHSFHPSLHHHRKSWDSRS